MHVSNSIKLRCLLKSENAFLTMFLSMKTITFCQEWNRNPNILSNSSVRLLYFRLFIDRCGALLRSASFCTRIVKEQIQRQRICNDRVDVYERKQK